MWTIARRAPAPQLHWLPGALARRQGDRIVLYPLGPAAPVELSLAAPTDAGHAVLLRNGSAEPEVVACYATRWQARRQFNRLADPRGGQWLEWLGRAALAAVLLFLVWFLFFLPVDPAARTTALPDGGAGGPSWRAEPPFPAPAWIDDPAEARPSR